MASAVWAAVVLGCVAGMPFDVMPALHVNLAADVQHGEHMFVLPASPECESAVAGQCTTVLRSCVNDACELQCTAAQRPVLPPDCLRTHPCADDVDNWCGDHAPGSIMACLHAHRHELDAACRRAEPCLQSDVLSADCGVATGLPGHEQASQTLGSFRIRRLGAAHSASPCCLRRPHPASCALATLGSVVGRRCCRLCLVAAALNRGTTPITTRAPAAAWMSALTTPPIPCAVHATLPAAGAWRTSTVVSAAPGVAWVRIAAHLAYKWWRRLGAWGHTSLTPTAKLP